MSIRGSVFKKSSLSAGIIAVLAMGHTPVSLADGAQRLKIDQQAISEAMVDLSSATGVQIMLSNDIPSTTSVTAINGEYSLDDALKLMLKDSGLSFEYVSEDTILIREGEDNSSKEESVEEADEEVVITGSRIKNLMPTSPVVVMSREEIDRRGLNSIEEIIRSLPQNFSSFTAPGSLDNTLTPGGGVGQSAANLRGLGSDATLILVNGRRVAGSTALFGEAANLNTLPFGAIERVEVLLDGAGAIYGSDAVAGIINFILKKNYSGMETSVRYENSSGGANNYTLEQTFGTTWESGSLSGVLSVKKSEGISAEDIGFTSRDFTDRGGFDRRSLLVTQSQSFVRVDDVRPMLSSDATSWSVTLNSEQQINSSSTLFADLIVSENDTSIVGSIPTGFGSVNAFHPAGPGFARYSFIEEFERGVVPRTSSGSKQERTNLNLGLKTELPFDDWQAEVVAGYSVESMVTTSFGLDITSPEYLLAALGQDIRFPEPGDDVTFIQPGDPFLDLFGPTSAAEQDEDFLRTFVGASTTGDEDSTTKEVEGYVEGPLLDLPGGELRLVLGGQYRELELDYSMAPRAANSFSNLRPGQTLQAAFFEFSLPIVGSENALPGMESLLLTASGRWDHYKNPEVQRQENVFETAKFNNFSPRLGMAWNITDELLLRASWGESFRAPGPFELNAPFFNFGPTFSPVDDPLTTDVVEEYRPIQFSEANPNLQPQTSKNTAIGIEWAPSILDGFQVSVTLNQIDYTNLITGSSVFSLIELLSDPTLVPGFAVRDPDTNEILEIHRFPINIAGRFSESVDFDVRYGMDTDVGTFEARLLGTYTSKLESVAREGAEPDASDATQSGPDRWKGSASLDWYRENYGATVILNYSSGYISNRFFDLDTFETATEQVESYSTVDISGFYHMPDTGWRFRGGVKNVTNASMPFLRGSFVLPYDPTRVDPEGRVMFVEARKSFDL